MRMYVRIVTNADCTTFGQVVLFQIFDCYCSVLPLPQLADEETQLKREQEVRMSTLSQKDNLWKKSVIVTLFL